MKIAIIGATGMAGKALYTEAISRGHEVTAFVRNADKAEEVLGDKATMVSRDAFDLTRADLENFDVVINAFASSPQTAYLRLDLAAKLVALFRETQNPRLFFILGAASLLDQNDKLFLKTLETAPDAAAWISICTEGYKELNFLRETDNVNWVGVSPSADFIPGEATVPVIGKDNLLFAADGKSHVTSGTMAVAILDEIENPQFIRTRFTVGDQ